MRKVYCSIWRLTLAVLEANECHDVGHDTGGRSHRILDEMFILGVFKKQQCPYSRTRYDIS